MFHRALACILITVSSPKGCPRTEPLNCRGLERAQGNRATRVTARDGDAPRSSALSRPPTVAGWRAAGWSHLYSDRLSRLARGCSRGSRATRTGPTRARCLRDVSSRSGIATLRG